MFMEQMTSEDARQYLVDIFARAGKPDNQYRTEEERLEYLSESGARIVRDKIFPERTTLIKRFSDSLGETSVSKVKSLENLAQILVETGVVSSLSEGRALVPRIAEANNLHSHAISRGLLKYLRFTEVKNEEDVLYRVNCII